MSLRTGNDPLHCHPLICTRSPEEMRHQMIAQFGASDFSAPTKTAFAARSNCVSLEHVTLAFCAYDSQASAEFPETDFARLQIPLRGSAATTVGGRTVDISARHGCVSSPGRVSVLQFGDGYEQIVVRIGRDALTSKLTALTGYPPKGELGFDPNLDTEPAAAQALLRLIGFCCTELDTAERATPAPVLRELEQSLVVAFLSATRHGYNHLLDRDAGDGAPWHVRRAEAFIEANWRDAIQIEDLVNQTGVSARTLARAFAAHRGYSPREFLKRVRLRQARAMLNVGSPEATVTAVALACNFSSLGRFSSDYRDAYGELPSVTLDRSMRRQG